MDNKKVLFLHPAFRMGLPKEGLLCHIEPKTVYTWEPILDTNGDTQTDINGDMLVERVGSVGLVDSVGDSELIITDGKGGDFVDMTFGFPYNASMAWIDTVIGGDVLFTGTTPISRTWYEWCELLNIDYLWIGQLGIAVYSIDMSAKKTQIESALDSSITATGMLSVVLDNYLPEAA